MSESISHSQERRLLDEWSKRVSITLAIDRNVVPIQGTGRDHIQTQGSTARRATLGCGVKRLRRSDARRYRRWSDTPLGLASFDLSRKRPSA
jgi:hypothetical protein